DAVQPVRPLAASRLPARCEPLVAAPTQQKGVHRQCLFELDLGPLFDVLASVLCEPAAQPEALPAVRVLYDSVERDVRAYHDPSHRGSPYVGLSGARLLRRVPRRKLRDEFQAAPTSLRLMR